MKLNLDLKTLVLIVSTACVVAGFYYTTEARLTSVEREALFLHRKVEALKIEDKRLNRLIRNIKKGQSR